MWAIKWSCVALLVTACLQLVVVALSGSVALLADTIHNFGDAATAPPLWVAFLLPRRRPTEQFTNGLGRFEDLADGGIVLIIALTALVAGCEAVTHLVYPQPVAFLGTMVGHLSSAFSATRRSHCFASNGYHARVDGWTSLAVLVGALGVWLGYPLADPGVGLLITAAILWLVWLSGTMVLIRALDGVDLEMITELRHAEAYVLGVQAVTEVQARWVGHHLRAEVSIDVSPELSVAEGHAIAIEARHHLLHHVRYLSDISVHVDPLDKAGEEHHRIVEHVHDGLLTHSH